MLLPFQQLFQLFVHFIEVEKSLFVYLFTHGFAEPALPVFALYQAGMLCIYGLQYKIVPGFDKGHKTATPGQFTAGFHGKQLCFEIVLFAIAGLAQIKFEHAAFFQRTLYPRKIGMPGRVICEITQLFPDLLRSSFYDDLGLYAARTRKRLRPEGRNARKQEKTGQEKCFHGV